MDKRLLVGALILLLVAGCTQQKSQTPGQETPTTPETGAQQPQTPQAQLPEGQTVNIKDFKFNPQNLAVQVGTTVTWINEDPMNNHRVYSQDNFDSDVLAPGQTWSYTFTEKKIYNVRDFIYPAIKGTVTVE